MNYEDISVNELRDWVAGKIRLRSTRTTIYDIDGLIASDIPFLLRRLGLVDPVELDGMWNPKGKEVAYRALRELCEKHGVWDRYKLIATALML